MSWLQRWITSWIDMLCGLVGGVSFGLYRPSWGFDFMIWVTKRNLKKRMAEDTSK